MMDSAKPSAPPIFKALEVPRFSVIRVPYQFEEETVALSKLFVVLGHVNGYAICIKATSQTHLYKVDESRMKGCVFYEGKQLSCFPEDTAIQPDNQFPIPHAHIEQYHAEGLVEIHPLPEDFQTRLQEAVKNCASLKPQPRSRIEKLIA